VVGETTTESFTLFVFLALPSVAPACLGVVHDLQVICGRVACGGELREKLTPLGTKYTDC